MKSSLLRMLCFLLLLVVIFSNLFVIIYFLLVRHPFASSSSSSLFCVNMYLCSFHSFLLLLLLLQPKNVFTTPSASRDVHRRFLLFLLLAISFPSDFPPLINTDTNASEHIFPPRIAIYLDLRISISILN